MNTEENEVGRGSTLLLLTALVVMLLVPGVRRFVYYRMLRNPTVRKWGMQLLVVSPWFRQTVLDRLIRT